jgi:hypothetical protein
MTDSTSIASKYFSYWREQDFDALRSVLADDVTFRGPLGTADGVDECVAGLRGMSQMMTGIDISVMVAECADVITWYDLHTKHAPPVPTANWMHLSGERITRIRAAFDPRPILGE